MKRKSLVYGVGINDANYAVRKQNTVCPYYKVWKSMLRRCYSAKFQDRRPTYKGCTVSEEWLTFSNFKNWMRKQDFEGKQLDKDLLIEGNKQYSPETCVFVTRMTNTFTIDSGATRGKWPIGVSKDKRSGKFIAKCRNPFTGEQDYLGSFDSEQEAHNAWAKRKLELAHELTFFIADPRVANALIDRYLPQVRE